MKRRVVNVFFAFGVLTACFGEGLLNAAFLEVPVAARPLALGGAFTSLSDDGACPVWNPAGITQIPHLEVHTTYFRPYLGLQNVSLNSNFINCVYNLKDLLSLGISWSNLSSALYTENVFYVTLGKIVYKRDVVRERLMERFVFEERLSIGVNLKVLEHHFKLYDEVRGDPVFGERSGIWATSIDLGALLRRDRYAIGVTLKNITLPDVGIFEEEITPIVIRAGISYRHPHVTTSIDAIYRGGVWDFGVGCETTASPLKIRFGVNRREVTIGGGLWLKLIKDVTILIDYGCSYPFRIKESLGSHLLSLSVCYRKFSPPM